MQWFRFYSEALNDPKVQSLEPELFKHWINLLCVSCNNNGTLPETFQQIAFHLRISDNAAITVIERLHNATLIDRVNGGVNGYRYAIHGWEKRQYKSDTSTERVKRFRGVSRNVTVTPPEQIQKQIQKEVKDITKVISKKTSLDELSVSHIQDWLNQKRAIGKYLMHDEVAILERFKDYCLSKGKKYNDYVAAYRNAFEWDTSQPKQKPRSDPATNALNAAQSIIARRNAAAGISGSPEPANNVTATNLRLPENIR